jgi:hypothetical protein
MSGISKKMLQAAAGSAGGGAGDPYYSRVDVTGTAGYVTRYYNVAAAMSDDGYVAHVYAGKLGSSYCAVVHVFDEKGNETFWKYDGFGSRYDATQPYDVAIDDAYVYVVHGYFEYPVTTVKDRVYMTCFDRDTGAIQWIRRYTDMRPSTNNCIGHRLINGASGELIMCGKFATSGGASSGGYIARISKADGSIVVSKRTGDGVATPTECVGLGYDADTGNIFFGLGWGMWSVNYALTSINNINMMTTSASGFAMGPNLTAFIDGQTEQFSVMNKSFTLQWGITPGSGTYLRDVMIDADDNVYLTRENGQYVDKYNSTGTHQWTRYWSGFGIGDNASPIATRENAGFIVRERPNASNLKHGVVKYPTDGTGTGVYGDLSYLSGSNPSWPTHTVQKSTLSGTLSSDIGSSVADVAAYWNNQGGTFTRNVYIIS